MRPSTLPLARLRSRAAFSFFTSRVFSSCENTPMICRIATRNSSSLSVQAVAGGGQDAYAQANQQRNAGLLGQQTGKSAGILDDDDAHAVAHHPLEECFEAWPASIGSLPDTAAS